VREEKEKAGKHAGGRWSIVSRPSCLYTYKTRIDELAKSMHGRVIYDHFTRLNEHTLARSSSATELNNVRPPLLVSASTQ